MKKALIALLILVSISVKSQLTPSNDTTRFGWIFSLGIGSSSLASLDNREAKDYIYFNQGLSTHAGLEIFYYFSKSPKSVFSISTGIGSASYSANALADADTRYNYNSASIRVPLHINLCRKVGDSGTSTLVSVGLYGRFTTSKESHLVTERISTGTFAKQSLSGNGFGMILRVGAKISLGSNAFYTATFNAETDLSSQTIETGAIWIGHGLGFNF